jgi:hypothetical protein
MANPGARRQGLPPYSALAHRIDIPGDDRVPILNISTTDFTRHSRRKKKRSSY